MSKVALIDDEYVSLKSGLSNVHADCLDQLDTVLKEIKSLNTKSGGFYADELTAKIGALATQLTGIRGKLKSFYRTNEATVTKFATKIKSYDKLG